MEAPDIAAVEQRSLVRWFPSALLDLPPAERVSAVRTPHRVVLQALPATKDVLASLLRAQPFELTLEIEDDTAPLRHVPVHEVHEARLTPDLPLDWSHYYWLGDGLLDDLAAVPNDPAAGFMRGRLRLQVAEDLFRQAKRGPQVDLEALETAWKVPPGVPAPDVERHGEPLQALQQFVRGLTGHLVEHASSRPFVDEARALLQWAEHRNDIGLPALGGFEQKLLSTYAQHRLVGSPWLTAPAGMIAGWHLLLSAHVLAVWYAGLMVQSKRVPRLRDALLTALWMLDQGFWSDEPLLHDVLRNLNASEYTSAELAAGLTAALRGAPVGA